MKKTKAKPDGARTDWLKDFATSVLKEKKTESQVKAILGDKDHPAFATMWGRLAERAEGRPVASEGDAGSSELVIRIVNE